MTSIAVPVEALTADWPSPSWTLRIRTDGPSSTSRAPEHGVEMPQCSRTEPLQVIFGFDAMVVLVKSRPGGC
jgi:hypothetical protein